MATEQTISIQTFDGLALAATLTLPDGPPERAAVLVHGGGVTRREGGFFDRFAAGLAAAGTASVRFDLRGHGDSEGRQEDLTLALVVSDIGTAIRHARDVTGAERAALIGASFAGGACGWYAARNELESLVLLNPQLDYRQRIMSRGEWQDGEPAGDLARQLRDQGWIQFTPTLRHGPSIVAESLHLDTGAELERIAVPVMIVHGDADTLVPVQGSREASRRIRDCRLMEVPGAQHGFAVDEDPRYQDPQSQEFQRDVIAAVSGWVRSPGR